MKNGIKLAPPAKKCIITAILLSFVCATAMSCGDDKKSTEEDACVTVCADETTALICVAGELVFTDCGDKKCYDGACVAATNQACTNESSECVGDISYRVCGYGFWSDIIPCSGDKVCQAGKCVAKPNGPQKESCTATQPECSPDNKGYRVCVQGNWSDVIPCSGTTTCKNGQCSGEDVTSNLPCKEGDEPRCVSDFRLQICGEDKFWRFMDCPADIPVCYDGECNPPECSTGDIECIGDSILATCVNSVWKREACPTDKPICQNNACIERPKECTPGDKKCISEKQTQKCNGNGFWEDDNFCSGTSTCFDGDCVEKCSPGEKMCVTDSKAYVCGVSGYWESVECTNDKICNKGECKTCKDGQTRCAGQQAVETCNNGSWKTTSCEYYCSPHENACIGYKDGCVGVVSFCSGTTLIWCTGTYLNYYSSYCGCVSAVDNVGATCTNQVWEDSKCSKVNATKQGWFGYFSSHGVTLTANCLQCKDMKDGSRRWVPVDESNCK